MIRVYNTLYELATAIGWEWPDNMSDLSSPKKFRVADTEDECWRVHDDGTRARRLNTETLQRWISDFNTPRWSEELQCVVTTAHFNRSVTPTLRGTPTTPERLVYLKRWREDNPDKYQANMARNDALPDRRLKQREFVSALYNSEWMIDHDIALSMLLPNCVNVTVRIFKANTSYKWSTLVNYYAGSGNTQAAIADGWYKL